MESSDSDRDLLRKMLAGFAQMLISAEASGDANWKSPDLLIEIPHLELLKSVVLIYYNR
jgi:hypothetical protein